jgi:hypothetical protein
VSGQLHVPAVLPPGKEPPGTHWTGDGVDPRASLDDMEERKFLTLLGLEPQPLGRPARSQLLYQLLVWAFKQYYNLLPQQFKRLQSWCYWWKNIWSTLLRWWDGLWWHNICLPKNFHEDWFRHIKFITTTIWETVMLVLLMGGIYEVHHWRQLRLPSFIKIGLSIQKLLVGDTYRDTQTARWLHKTAFIFILLS